MCCVDRLNQQVKAAVGIETEPELLRPRYVNPLAILQLPRL